MPTRRANAIALGTIQKGESESNGAVAPLLRSLVRISIALGLQKLAANVIKDSVSIVPLPTIERGTLQPIDSFSIGAPRTE
jgi:hypothetical protein